MRAVLLFLALFGSTASAEESERRIDGFGAFILGATVDEAIIAAGEEGLEETDTGNSVQRLLRTPAPVIIAGQSFEMRLQFEPSSLSVISLHTYDEFATHDQCLQSFRAVTAELATTFGPLNGERTGFEAPWPAPRIERQGTSELRLYAFTQHRGAVLHRAVASARSGGIIEIAASAWDGGVHDVPVPPMWPPVRCRLSIEVKTELGT